MHVSWAGSYTVTNDASIIVPSAQENSFSADVPTREFILLGTGTSVGVPLLGCQCDVCRSTDPKLHRTRSSAYLSSPFGGILIDTGPDLRQQFLREGLTHADAILMTHHHADHIFGLDDIRAFNIVRGGSPLPIYCELEVEKVLRRAFAYAFEEGTFQHSKSSIPKIEFHRILRPRFDVLGEQIVPIPLKHGPTDVLGFRFGKLAYCTDVNEIPAPSWELLQGVEILIIDALRMEPHPTHFSFYEALDIIQRLGPRKAYMTHISCRLDPVEAARHLPADVELGYDGLRIPF